MFQKITRELELKLGKEARAIDVAQIADPDLLRKLGKLSNIGTAALDAEDKGGPSRYDISTKMKGGLAKKMSALHNGIFGSVTAFC